jgi:hypothetical protein
VAVLTFETRTDALRMIARSHAQLIAAGRRIAAECGLANDGGVLSAIPLTSFAGLSAALLPWLIGGGTLSIGAKPARWRCSPPARRTSAFLGAAPLAVGCDGLLDTGFPCHVHAERGTLSITGAPPGLAMIGSYAFSRSAVDETLGEAAPEASVIVVPDLLLGDRFAGRAPNARLELRLNLRSADSTR